VIASHLDVTAVINLSSAIVEANLGSGGKKSTVPRNPQVSSISLIRFTEMKFKSQSPSVTPSVRVLVRFPVHVSLRVEAAFASINVPRTSQRVQINVKHFGICAAKERVGLH
jgi:hypothetical protein